MSILRRARWLTLLGLALFSGAALADVSILVRDEQGFQRFGGDTTVLEHNGPTAAVFGGMFELSYAADTFSVRVTQDYGGGLPFGFAAYRSFYTPLPFDDPNSLAFIPIVSTIPANTVFSERIAPIPEPGTWLFGAVAVMVGVVRFSARPRRA